MIVIAALIVVAFVATIVALAVVLGAGSGRPAGRSPAVTDTSVRPPATGDRSPTRYGDPVPGSRADRLQHGKP
jgi:hypothetical protein